MPKIPRSERRAQMKAEKVSRFDASRATSSPTAKVVRSPQYAQTKIVPRGAEDPRSIMNMLIRACLTNADREGEWPWGTRDWDAGQQAAIDHFFVQQEDVSWREAATGGYHGVRKIANFVKDARDRWQGLGWGEFDTAFRFRVDGLHRLYGIRQVGCFHLIWNDPTHKINPAKKRNT